VKVNAENFQHTFTLSNYILGLHCTISKYTLSGISDPRMVYGSQMNLATQLSIYDTRKACYAPSLMVAGIPRAFSTFSAWKRSNVYQGYLAW
jgi:hypothetical protein